MPEEMIWTAVTAAENISISDEEAISQIASEAVSEAMETAGVTSAAESEEVPDSEMPESETDVTVTDISTFPQTVVDSEAENAEMISEEAAAETENDAVLLPEETETVIGSVTESVTETAAVIETALMPVIQLQQMIGPLLLVGLGAAALAAKKMTDKKK